MLAMMLKRSLIELKNGEFRNLLKKTAALALRKFVPGPLSFPHRLIVELTNHCNLDCVMCPRKLRTDKTGYMTRELFTQIVDECAKSCCFGELVLSGLGEPLLHPEVIDLIKLAKIRGVSKVRLTTNAVSLTKEKSAEIIGESGLDEIGISLDALTAESYEKTKRRPHFLTVQKNIIDFLEQRKMQGRSKPFVKLHMLKLPKTASERDGFARQWRPLLGKGDHILFKEVHNYSGIVEDLENQRHDNQVERTACSQLWTLLFISWNGNVEPCCGAHSLGQSSLGNIKESSIGQFWTGVAMQKMRQLHLRGQYDQIPFCKSCEIWWYFGKKPKTID